MRAGEPEAGGLTAPPDLGPLELEQLHDADRYVLAVARYDLRLESARSWDELDRHSARAWDDLALEDERSALDLRKFRRRLARIAMVLALLVAIAGTVDVIVNTVRGRPSLSERRILRTIDAIGGGERPSARADGLQLGQGGG